MTTTTAATTTTAGTTTTVTTGTTTTTGTADAECDETLITGSPEGQTGMPQETVTFLLAAGPFRVPHSHPPREDLALRLLAEAR
jgi:hypothetical protein